MGMAAWKVPDVSGTKVCYFYTAFGIDDGYQNGALDYIGPFSSVGVPVSPTGTSFPFFILFVSVLIDFFMTHLQKKSSHKVHNQIRCP